MSLALLLGRKALLVGKGGPRVAAKRGVADADDAGRSGTADGADPDDH